MSDSKTKTIERVLGDKKTLEAKDRRPIEQQEGTGKGSMKNIKFVVKVNRGGAHAPQYVLRMDRVPIQTTSNRKLALVMGRFTAEDAVKLMQNSHCNPELVSVRVSA